jgi:hypothetical protein
MFLGSRSHGHFGFFGRLMVATIASAAATLLVINSGCSHDGAAGGGPVVVPLSYAPQHAKDSIRPYPAAVPQTKVFIGKFEDKRDKMDAIGVNVEHSDPVPVVAGTDPVEFFRQTLATQLRNAGLTVVDDVSQADRIVTGDVTRLWVEESSNYQADVAATVRVSDKAGVSRWDGAATGHGETFGKSLSPENYREAISDAMVRFTYDSLVINSGFQNALK